MNLFRNSSFLFLIVLTLRTAQMLNAVEPTHIKPDLACLKNQIESSKAVCFFENGCCHSFASDRCRIELTSVDINPLEVTFIEGSISMDRDNNRLCFQGLKPTPKEHYSGFYGVQLFVRKEEMYSTREEVVSMNFMFQHLLLGAVPPNENRLESLLMCMDLGDEIDSFSQDTFISVEMITLRPQRDEPAVSYPGFHMLCSLDTIKIQSSGCQLESVTRVPHTCNMTQDYDYVTENEIESTIEHGTGFGHLDDDLFPQKEPRATPNPPVNIEAKWTTMELVLSLTITAILIIGCAVAIFLGIYLRSSFFKRRSNTNESPSEDLNNMATPDQKEGYTGPNSQQRSANHKESTPQTTSSLADESEEAPYSQQVLRNSAFPRRKHHHTEPASVSLNMNRLLDQEARENEQLLGENTNDSLAPNYECTLVFFYVYNFELIAQFSKIWLLPSISVTRLSLPVKLFGSCILMTFIWNSFHMTNAF
ncbi:uncharacterized protein LOC142340140 isoform X2 [Convolutriloba macropyga]|uniref:uncharacterized protein LOC142340140 isoform X2 n=1 Tax=Convolutriloba macropyga TaxID=536237 RepID=UPI003F51E4F9